LAGAHSVGQERYRQPQATEVRAVNGCDVRARRKQDTPHDHADGFGRGMLSVTLRLTKEGHQVILPKATFATATDSAGRQEACVAPPPN